MTHKWFNLIRITDYRCKYPINSVSFLENLTQKIVPIVGMFAFGLYSVFEIRWKIYFLPFRDPLKNQCLNHYPLCVLNRFPNCRINLVHRYVAPHIFHHVFFLPFTLRVYFTCFAKFFFLPHCSHINLLFIDIVPQYSLPFPYFTGCYL